jgi:hypothetical protein
MQGVNIVDSVEGDSDKSELFQSNTQACFSGKRVQFVTQVNQVYQCLFKGALNRNFALSIFFGPYI